MQWQRGVNHVITQKMRYAVAKGNKSCHNPEMCIVQYTVAKGNKSCHNPEMRIVQYSLAKGSESCRNLENACCAVFGFDDIKRGGLFDI